MPPLPIVQDSREQSPICFVGLPVTEEVATRKAAGIGSHRPGSHAAHDWRFHLAPASGRKEGEAPLTRTLEPRHRSQRKLCRTVGRNLERKEPHE